VACSNVKPILKGEQNGPGSWTRNLGIRRREGHLLKCLFGARQTWTRTSRGLVLGDGLRQTTSQGNSNERRSGDGAIVAEKPGTKELIRGKKG